MLLRFGYEKYKIQKWQEQEKVNPPLEVKITVKGKTEKRRKGKRRKQWRVEG
jgi:hypothetical protein